MEKIDSPLFPIAMMNRFALRFKSWSFVILCIPLVIQMSVFTSCNEKKPAEKKSLHGSVTSFKILFLTTGKHLQRDCSFMKGNSMKVLEKMNHGLEL